MPVITVEWLASACGLGMPVADPAWRRGARLGQKAAAP